MAVKESRCRNYCLDFVKGIACICIVFMHCEFPGRFGIIIQSISRFCVPFFFMVSGYFCYKESGIVDYKKKVIHIGLITGGATALYFVINVIIRGMEIQYSPKKLLYWILFNEPFVIAGQMWFLFALLYDYVLYALIDKYKALNIVRFLIPVLIAAYICLAQGASLFGIDIPNAIYRNFMIEGLAFFSLGNWIHVHQAKLNVSNKFLVMSVVIFTFLCPFERFLLGRDFGVNISTFPQVIAIFLLCLNKPGFGKNTKISVLGLKYSLYVYVFHPAIWHFLENYYAILNIDDSRVALYLMPIFCASFSIVASVVYTKVLSIIKIKKERIYGYYNADN